MFSPFLLFFKIFFLVQDSRSWEGTTCIQGGSPLISYTSLKTVSCIHRSVSRVIPKSRKIDNKDKSIYQNDFPLLPVWPLSWALCLRFSSSWVAFEMPHKKRADTIHMPSGLRSTSFNNHSPWYWKDNSYTMRLIYSLTTSSCRHHSHFRITPKCLLMLLQWLFHTPISGGQKPMSYRMLSTWIHVTCSIWLSVFALHYLKTYPYCLDL